MRMSTGRLADLTDQLERAAARLRAGELESDAAASLVETCARLASEAASELDRQARAVSLQSPPGQAELPDLAGEGAAQDALL